MRLTGEELTSRLLLPIPCAISLWEHDNKQTNESIYQEVGGVLNGVRVSGNHTVSIVILRGYKF